MAEKKPLPLVQARLPKRAYLWIKQKAAKRGLTVGAWIRQHFMAEMEKDP